MENLNVYTDKLISMALSYAPRVLLAVVALVIGFWMANKLTSIVRKRIRKTGMDEDVQPFFSSLVNVIIKVMVVISVAGMIGIQTTSFIAVLGAATLAVGMALQGSLGNFASGVMILIFKPYRVGDVVNVQGTVGAVHEIQIFNTIINSGDNKRVIVPNAIATSGIITNLSANEWLRVDLNITVPYESDYSKVRDIVLAAVKATPKVMTAPEPYVEIEAFDENGLKLCVRPHATTSDYWDVYFGAYRNVKEALAREGIPVPYPKRLNATV